jgi:hypothetical protein
LRIEKWKYKCIPTRSYNREKERQGEECRDRRERVGSIIERRVREEKGDRERERTGG